MIYILHVAYIEYRNQLPTSWMGRVLPVLSFYLPAIGIILLYEANGISLSPINAFQIVLSFFMWIFITGTTMELIYAIDNIKNKLYSYSVPLYKYMIREVLKTAMKHWINLAIFLISLYIVLGSSSIRFIFFTLLIAAYTLSLVFAFASIVAIYYLKFRDLAQLLLLLFQGFFYITPILWIGEGILNKYTILKYNPFYFYFTELKGLFTTGAVSELSIFLLSGLSGLLIITAYAYSNFSYIPETQQPSKYR